MAVNIVDKNKNFVSEMVQMANKLVSEREAKIGIFHVLKAIDDRYTEEDFGNLLQQSDLDEPTGGNELDHLLVNDVVNFITAIRAINTAIDAQSVNLYKLIR